MTRIPITMCHGTNDQTDLPLTKEHFDGLIAVAHEMQFQSIHYDHLAAWREGGGELPGRPIMFDFDHPVETIWTEVREVFERYGYIGTLFINTGPMSPGYDSSPGEGMECMTWDQIGQLVEGGWHIGAHTVTHPNLSQLSLEDPTGAKLREELDQCNAEIERQLGKRPRDFAFTGTSWSSAAEEAVMERYRFGRLWIVGNEYSADGEIVRYADLVGVDGDDESDGGPPMAARYITKESPAYRLPSVEFQCKLMYQPEQFRAYLKGALS